MTGFSSTFGVGGFTVFEYTFVGPFHVPIKQSPFSSVGIILIIPDQMLAIQTTFFT